MNDIWKDYVSVSIYVIVSLFLQVSAQSVLIVPTYLWNTVIQKKTLGLNLLVF